MCAYCGVNNRRTATIITTMADDELAEINGVKPKRVIKDSEEVEAKSQTRCVLHACRATVSAKICSNLTSKAVYNVKRTFDHYYWCA
jgi:hypothetical protein